MASAHLPCRNVRSPLAASLCFVNYRQCVVWDAKVQSAATVGVRLQKDVKTIPTVLY